jgi:hypothetical protein
MKVIKSIPNASRTFEALRALGYDLNAAVADVVDNAITEKVAAACVDVTFAFRNGQVICRVKDDGCGMNEKELEEAMRLGVETEYEPGDLGKFGMGMKTASLTHCNILTVISKKKRSPICGFRWDISHIKQKGWEVLQLDQREIVQILSKEKTDLSEPGTLVLWDDLFYINKEFRSYSNEKLAQNFYFRLEEQLKLHLRMVYHRFLDGSLGKGATIHIRLNNQPLKPWDPFYRQEEHTEQIGLKKEDARFKLEGYRAAVDIEAYILPTQEAFSSETAWKEAKGPQSWNDGQGYYIYRANRLIRFGGWQGTKAKDEHDKLARISIDIDPSLDEAFRISVQKNLVDFPEALFHHLKNLINPLVVKKAKVKYNKSEDNLTVKNTFRRNSEDISRVSRKLIADHGIRTSKARRNGTAEPTVTVVNPNGTWTSNKLKEFLDYGSDADYEIVSGKVENGYLWKIICDEDSKFKVVINATHPFYTSIYKTAANKAATSAIDALIFSLAFSELYNKSEKNAQLFDAFKTVVSKALERLTKEKIF